MLRYVLEKPAVVMAVSITALVGLGVLLWAIARGDIAADFAVYWRTANSPVGQAYSPDHIYPFPYAPTMLLWIKPLALVPQWPMFILWAMLSAAVLYTASRQYLTRGESLVVIACPAALTGMLSGQVTLFLAAAMVWAFGTDRRILAGVALGIVATIKPQLVLMAPILLLVRGDWRAIGGAAGAFVATIALELILYGPAPWLAWISAFDDFHQALYDMNIIRLAATPAAVAEKFGFQPLPFLAIGAVVGAWLVYQCRNLGPLETTAAVAAGSLLAAPYGLTYDLVALSPFLVKYVFRSNSIISAAALAGAPHPLPIMLAAGQLFRSTGNYSTISIEKPDAAATTVIDVSVSVPRRSSK